MTDHPITVVYHWPCPDGMACRVILHKVFGDAATYLPSNYNDELPDFTDQIVYLVDFSYKRDQLLQILDQAHGVTILDHHRSAVRELADLEHPSLTKVLDDTGRRAGCGICWDHFFPGQPLPPIFRHVQDRDLWLFELPDTMAISHALSLLDGTWEAWRELETADLAQLAAQGRTIAQVRDRIMAEQIRWARTVTLFGHPGIPFIENCPTTLISETLNKLAADAPFAACRIPAGPDQYKWSLRSVPPHGLDVSAIAARFGGGGHPHAAGFHTPADHPDPPAD